MHHAIELKGVKKHFGRVKALDGISFSVEQGEIFGFLGPNGAGKTTAIRCMLDFIRPTSGKVLILGKDAQADSEVIKNDISYVASGMKLYDHWTGQDHLSFFSELRHDGSQINELVERFKFNPKTKVRNLSFGNKQKLALLLALIGKPKLIILDEPTVGLDPLLQNTIYALLQELRDQGSTIFMSSHNLKEVEDLCTRVAIIKDGKIIAVESISELKRKRLYLINVKTKDSDSVLDTLPHAQDKVISRQKNAIAFSTGGDINTVVNKLTKTEIKELEITRADLDDIFLEFYK